MRISNIIMKIPQKDKAILRNLGQRVAEIAHLPIQLEKAGMWRRLNRLDPVRPMVNWHMENLCWPELLPDSLLESESAIGRDYERHLRRILYQWDNLRDDKVIEAIIPYRKAIRNTGLGILPRLTHPEQEHGGAKAFETVLAEETDIEKIQMPRVSVDEETTDRNRQICEEIFDGILEPAPKQVLGWGFPTLDLIDHFTRLRGVQQMYMDLMDRPEWVHEVLERMLQAAFCALEQYEELGLLRLNNGANEIGTSALGFTDELPQPDFDGSHVRPEDLWGFSVAQIFVGVGQDMHEEFSVRYESRYLKRFGLNLVGCCEPLERKMDVIRAIPNLRVISMSEWVDREKAAEELKGDFVFAYKPTGSYLAAENWNLEAARRDLEDLLEKAKGCVVEIHHNACSTCRNQPRRIHEWVEMAMKLVNEHCM